MDGRSSRAMTNLLAGACVGDDDGNADDGSDGGPDSGVVGAVGEWAAPAFEANATGALTALVAAVYAPSAKAALPYRPAGRATAIRARLRTVRLAPSSVRAVIVTRTAPRLLLASERITLLSLLCGSRRVSFASRPARIRPERASGVRTARPPPATTCARPLTQQAWSQRT